MVDYFMGLYLTHQWIPECEFYEKGDDVLTFVIYINDLTNRDSEKNLYFKRCLSFDPFSRINNSLEEKNKIDLFKVFHEPKFFNKYRKRLNLEHHLENSNQSHPTRNIAKQYPIKNCLINHL